MAAGWADTVDLRTAEPLVLEVGATAPMTE